MTKRARKKLANTIVTLEKQGDDYSLTSASAMLHAWSVSEERLISIQDAYAIAGRPKAFTAGDVVELLTDSPISVGKIVGKSADGDFEVERNNGKGRGFFREDEMRSAPRPRAGLSSSSSFQDVLRVRSAHAGVPAQLHAAVVPCPSLPFDA